MSEPARSPYVMASMAVHLFDLMRWAGHPADAVLARAGITRDELAPRSGRLPLTIAARLLHAGLEVAQDPQLLLRLSKVTYSNGFGVLAFLAQSCPTLRDAIDNMIRYGPLMSNAGHATLEHEPGLALWTLTIDHDDPVLQRQANEYLLGVGYRFLLLVDGRRSDIVREIRFRHPPPDTAAQQAAYAEVFSCPVRFNAPHNALVLDARSLGLPLRQPDVSLKDVVEQQVQKKMSELEAADPGFPGQVRRELGELLRTGQQASREALAERLGVSSRHLGRLLGHAGLSYRELVDETRLEIARQQLLGSERTVTDIGAQLGFADGPSFIRWFRQTTGSTPGEFRQRGG